MAIFLNKENFGIFPAGVAGLERYQAVRVVARELQDPTAAGRVTGVVDLDEPKLGQATQIQISGIAKVRCSGTVAQDDEVTTDSDGLISAAATVGQYILGQALDAGAAGEIISVILIKNLRQA